MSGVYSIESGSSPFETTRRSPHKGREEGRKRTHLAKVKLVGGGPSQRGASWARHRSPRRRGQQCARAGLCRAHCWTPPRPTRARPTRPQGGPKGAPKAARARTFWGPGGKCETKGVLRTPPGGLLAARARAFRGPGGKGETKGVLRTPPGGFLAVRARAFWGPGGKRETKGVLRGLGTVLFEPKGAPDLDLGIKSLGPCERASYKITFTN